MSAGSQKSTELPQNYSSIHRISLESCKDDPDYPCVLSPRRRFAHSSSMARVQSTACLTVRRTTSPPKSLAVDFEGACTASPSSDAVPCSRDGDDGPLHPSSSRLAEATALATPSHRSRRLSGLGCHCASVDVVVDAERGTDANSTSLPTSEQVFSLVGRATISNL